MRVSIIGQAPFGQAVLKRLQDEGHTIAAVSAPPPGDGARPDPLWAAATEAGLPLVPTASLKDPAEAAAWRAFDAELCVMAFVTEIIPGEVLSAPAHGTIQYHPSLLPLHRGSSAINWAIILGREETGISIFWPDAGVDTGPILLQKRCPIGPGDTVGSLYFDRLFAMGIDAIAESVKLVAEGNAPQTAQEHALSTYEPPCREAHAQLRWHEPADRLYALVRGCNPQPGAWATYEGAKLRFFDSRLTGGQEAGIPGRVLRVGDAGFDVRLNGGVLSVQRVQPEGGRKVPASEWAASVGLQPGARFR